MVKKILVVDDEPDVRTTLATILEREGFQTITGENGDDCLSLVIEHKPDLVLLDVMMPGTPVKEIILQIKNISIVFMSVFREQEINEEGLLDNANVLGLLQKPLDTTLFVSKVKEFLK